MLPLFHPIDGVRMDEYPGAGFTPPLYPVSLGWWGFFCHLIQRPHVIGIVPTSDLHPAIFKHHLMISWTKLSIHQMESVNVGFCTNLRGGQSQVSQRKACLIQEKSGDLLIWYL